MTDFNRKLSYKGYSISSYFRFKISEGDIDKDLEEIIVSNPKYAYLYARDVLKSRWTEAEKYIVKDKTFSVAYAMSVIKGRWPEAEKYIIKDRRARNRYISYVIKGRWIEAEPFIARDLSKDLFISNYYAGDYKVILEEKDELEVRYRPKLLRKMKEIDVSSFELQEKVVKLGYIHKLKVLHPDIIKKYKSEVVIRNSGISI